MRLILSICCLLLASCGSPFSEPGNHMPESPVIWEPKPHSLGPGNGGQLLIRASESINLLHAAWNKEEGGQDLLFSQSRNEGQTFSKSFSVNNKPGAVRAHGENGPQLQQGKGRGIYAAWGQSRDIYFSRSRSFGKNFETPIRVNDDTGQASQSFQTMTVGPDGTVYVAWLDGRDKNNNLPGTSSLYFARSTDRGASFEQNIKVSGAVCPCCRPSFAFGDSGEVFISWRHVFEGNNRVIVVASSRDKGTTWSEPVKTLEEGWRINGCAHAGSALGFINGKLLVTWYTGAEGRASLKLARSSDKGRTFEDVKEIQGKVLDANHPYMMEVGKENWILFQGRNPNTEGGWGMTKAWLVRVATDGSVSKPEAIPSMGGSVSFPMLFKGNAGRLYATWTEINDQGTQVVLCRGRIRA